jgi:hypothetical protein
MPTSHSMQANRLVFTPFDQPHSTSLVYGIELVLYIYSQEQLFCDFTIRLLEHRREVERNKTLQRV